ncbi:MAG: phosphoribosylaminoimidazolesuccinocarboxamide synthase [Deltaproteobacteria bacterium]|nr:phosphoribosylaminoimidazolesuccinocarboxamide synthase [Deltaproteobacteria bacterium]
MQTVQQTDIRDLPLLSRGKVRDIYEIDPTTLLIVTTDRISAFDVIMPQPIPFKGVILNRITLFWMDMFKEMIPNHLLAVETRDFPAVLKPHADLLEGRAVVVRKASPLPIECIVRGYITGSGWKDYRRTGKICGHKLPAELRESQILPEPIFTPSTKAGLGDHDENITLAQARTKVGEGLVQKVQEISLAMYSKAREYAASRDIIIADTKFEFGLDGRNLILIDEVLTPDSSRFWPGSLYEVGRSQPSFDKQFLRDWLIDSGWDKKSSPPDLPPEVIAGTRGKYMDAYRLLTGSDIDLPGL